MLPTRFSTNGLDACHVQLHRLRLGNDSLQSSGSLLPKACGRPSHRQVKHPAVAYKRLPRRGSTDAPT